LNLLYAGVVVYPLLPLLETIDMKRLLLSLLIIVAAPLTAVAAKPNVLLLCIDDLRPELKSFGASYIHSPNIDKLAASGRAFSRHYVQAPTCGASRYALLTGNYGRNSAMRGNGALFARSRNARTAPVSLPRHFRNNGYTTVSIGKVSHHPGGLGGKHWADPQQPEMPGDWTRHLQPVGRWQHPEGVMHGLANGEIRGNAKEMDIVQSFDGPDTAYPDGLTTDTALTELDTLSKAGKPFLLAVGIIRPHLPFGAPAKYMKPYDGVKIPGVPHATKPEGKTTWHGSGEFMKYNRWGSDPRKDEAFATIVRRHYAACVTYADALTGRILKKLEETGQRKNTIVVLWGDHGWHLGEHAIWGKHSLFEEALRSPLIIAAPMSQQPGVFSNSVVETIDIFPTLCDLCGLQTPEHLDGVSLLPQLKNPQEPGHTAVAYQNSRETIRTSRYRLIRHYGRGGTTHIELYDHQSEEGETSNLASELPEVKARLLKQLAERLK